MEGSDQMTNMDSEGRMKSIAESALALIAARTLILLGIPSILGLMAWNLSATSTLSGKIVGIEQWELDHSHDAYTEKMASSDFSVRDDRIAALKASFDGLDGRISYIERNGVKR